MLRISRRSSGAGEPPMCLSASLIFQDGRSLSVTITQLSHLGCKLSTEEMLPVSEVVRIEVPGQEMPEARVHWSMFGKAGLLFLRAPNTARLAGEI